MSENYSEPPPAKKPYTPPTLIVHGTLEEITRGGVLNTGGGGTGGTGTNGTTTGSHIAAG